MTAPDPDSANIAAAVDPEAVERLLARSFDVQNITRKLNRDQTAQVVSVLRDAARRAARLESAP
jgi:hypothetical protein